MILLVRIASRVGGNLAEDGTELEIPHLGCPWGVKYQLASSNIILGSTRSHFISTNPTNRFEITIAKTLRVQNYAAAFLSSAQIPQNGCTIELNHLNEITKNGLAAERSPNRLLF